MRGCLWLVDLNKRAVPPKSAVMTYAQDSFFTLGLAERFGLLCLSLLLFLILIALGWMLMRTRPVAVRIAIAIVVFALFIWLSPQVYYTYYRMIFDGLPAQLVIGSPPFAEMLKAARFSGPSNLSAHSQGALFWALIVMALAARGLNRLMSSTKPPQKPQR